MKILAIDPGFERVGVAVLEKTKNEEVLLYSDCFRTKASFPFPVRLSLIGQEIKRVVKKYRPGSIAIETLFFNTNQKTATKVSEARGVIIYEASTQGLQVYEYTPLQIKIAITGYGKATKEQVSAMVKQLIDTETANRARGKKTQKKKLDDEFDAIAIGLTHCAHHKTTGNDI